MSNLDDLRRKRAELDRLIATAEQEAKEAENKRRTRRWDLLQSRLDDALIDALAPDHSRTSCSDEKPVNEGRCDRCTLIAVRDGSLWTGQYDFDFHITRLPE